MSAALPKRLYRDPLKSLIELEEATCVGCVHEFSVRVRGQELKLCELRKPHGKRCKRYEAAGS